MSEEFDVRVTQSLHPLNVREVDGFEESVAHYLAPVETAFSEAYIGIGAVHTARAAAARNPVWNEAQQVIATQGMADKVLAKVARGFDSVRANLDRGIKALESELQAPVTSRAAHSVAAEIRGHVKGLAVGERMEFLETALKSGDDVSLTAVLGAPAYLAGLAPEMQQVFLRRYHEATAPQVALRLKVMKGAKSMIEQRAGLVFTELEKAVGMRPDKVRALRAAQSASEQAFVFREV